MFVKFISRLEESILCTLLVTMTLLVFVEVIMRFGFNSGIHWAQEVTLLLASWFVLFGASYGIKVGCHIGVDALIKLFSDKVNRMVTMFTILLSLIYCGLFIYGGWIYIGKLYKIGIELEDVPIPKWIPTSIILIGFALLAIRLLQLLWKVWTHQATGFQLADEVKDSMAIAKELEQAQAQAESSASANKGGR